MRLKINLFLFLFYNIFINGLQALDENEHSDEIEIYKHLFAKLNQILEDNTIVKYELNNLNNRIIQLEQKLDNQNPVTTSLAGPVFDAKAIPTITCNSFGSATDITDNYCFGHNWTLIQRRSDGSENFYRDWNDYKKGFGKISNEFFIGLEQIHSRTSAQPHELLIIMQDFDNSKRYAKYDLFEIGSESEQYVLKKLGKYSGNAGDSLTYHKGSKFSTKGKDNDDHPEFNCAEKFRSAWWFKACHESNLNGCYSDANLWSPHAAVACGIHWKTFRGPWYSLKSVEIMIRPKI